MSQHRAFLSQETLDVWLADNHVEVDSDVLSIGQKGPRLRLETALHFTEELEGGDPHQLIGKAFPLSHVSGLGGEHYADSVIIEDCAYQVTEGFVGTPLDTLGKKDKRQQLTNMDALPEALRIIVEHFATRS